MAREISNKGVFKLKRGKMLFSRFGPMSGQVQENRHRRPTPTRKGIWVFPYPFFEMFYAYHQINRFLPKTVRGESGAAILGLPTDIKDFSNMNDDGTPVKILTPEEELALEKEAEAYWAEKNKIEEEYLERFAKVKKIWWGGEIYSRLQPNPQSQPIGDDWYWYKKPIDFLEVARKNLIEMHPSYDGGPTVSTAVGFQGVGKENWWRLAQDHFECFLPTT